MKVFDLVLMLPEGHKQLNAMNVKYEEICGGSGPLFGIQCIEYIILVIHTWVVAPCWKVAVPSSECTKWHTKIPGSAILYTHRVQKKEDPVRNEAHHVDLE
jgi:hypothetical protein